MPQSNAVLLSCPHCGKAVIESTAPLVIAAGKRYITRSGRMARVYATDGIGSHPVHGAIRGDVGWDDNTWRGDGVFGQNGYGGLDLVAEAPEASA